MYTTLSCNEIDISFDELAITRNTTEFVAAVVPQTIVFFKISSNLLVHRTAAFLPLLMM